MKWSNHKWGFWWQFNPSFQTFTAQSDWSSHPKATGRFPWRHLATCPWSGVTAHLGSQQSKTWGWQAEKTATRVMENRRCARNKTIGQTVLRQTHLYVFWVEVLGWSISKLSGTPIPEDALILTYSQLLKSASTSDNGKWGGVKHVSNKMAILGYSEQNRTYLSILYDVSCLICL